MSIETHGKELVEQVTRERLEPDWLRELRFRSLAATERLPSPLFEKSDLGCRTVGCYPPLESDPISPELYDLDTLFGRRDGKNRLVFANDKIAEHRLQALIAKKGVMFTSLSMAVRLFPKLVQPYLGQVIPPETNKWVAMQTAIWNTGAFLYVPKRVRVTLPLNIWWHRTLGGGQFHPRLLVVAEENSEVTLVMGETSDLEEDAFSILVAEVIAKQGAQVRLVSLQEQSESMTRLSFAKAQVGRDAQVKWLYADGGTGYSVVDMNVQLEADGAAAKIKSLILGAHRQHLDLTMTTLHRGQGTHSEIDGLGILSGQANTSIHSVSDIDTGALGATSRQTGRMILLDETAKASVTPTMPATLAAATCEQAVSVGGLPEEQLFYLMARGLKDGQAKRMLLRGYLERLLTNTSMNGVKKYLHVWLERKVRV